MKQDVTEMKRIIIDLLNNNDLSNNEKNELITKRQFGLHKIKKTVLSSQ